MKQSGWSFGWSMYGLPSIMGQSLVDLDFLRSRMHILNMRIKTKKYLHISTSQSFFCLHQKPTEKTHQNLPLCLSQNGWPSFTGDLPVFSTAPRCTEAPPDVGYASWETHQSPKPGWFRLVLEVLFKESQLRKHGKFSFTTCQGKPRSQNGFFQIFSGLQIVWGLFVCC